jgi:hypothetical protein
MLTDMKAAARRGVGGGVMTATIDHLTESFNIHEPKDSPYFYLCCRICKLTWYLPKPPERRTKEAFDILADHAVSHGTRRPCNGGGA